MKKYIDGYKKEINEILNKQYFIESEKKEEKNPKNYNGFDKNEIVKEPTISKPFNYTNDIMLILLLLENDYINYLHYKNIVLCYSYMKTIYDKNSLDNKNNIINKLDELFLKHEFYMKGILLFEGYLNSERNGNSKEYNIFGELKFES